MDELTKCLELAALPDNEWRTLCSAMAYYLRHKPNEPHASIDRHFAERPTLEDWEQMRHDVTECRLAAEAAGFVGKQMTRNEYMRLYMKRARLKKGV